MEETTKKKSPVLPIVIVLVALGAGYYAFTKIMYSLHNEDTENSQIEANINSIVPKVPGYVEEIRVKENQLVHKGDTLVRIDDRDLRIRVQQAEVALENAKANVDYVRGNSGTASASVVAANVGTQSAQANIEAAEIRVWQANQDYERFKKLFDLGSATQQQFDNAKAAKETAEKQLEGQKRILSSLREQVNVSRASSSASEKSIRLAELMVEQRAAELDLAKLQLSYATLVAPCDGYVSKKNIQVGQLVNAGQNLFAIVDESELWVTANFKETQIEKMKVGQPVKVEVDAYPDVEFNGSVESFSSATGSRFALLPPDNATGNFVKVVQRIPVRIALKNAQDKNHPLRAGMNVKVIVKTS
ncbi:MAG: HlyD family secretion protein [Chitinophagales bacterium]